MNNDHPRSVSSFDLAELGLSLPVEEISPYFLPTTRFSDTRATRGAVGKPVHQFGYFAPTGNPARVPFGDRNNEQ